VGSDGAQELRTGSLKNNDADQDENDPTQRMTEKLGWDSGHNPPTRYDADAGGWEEGAQSLPGCVFMEGSNRKDIGKNQKRKNNSGGFPSWKNFGHKEDCEQAERPKA